MMPCPYAGRIASHYYIQHGTIDAFNRMLAPHLSAADALHVLCSSAEFDQLKVRPEELPEIDAMKRQATIPIRGSHDDTPGKVSILLQSYLSRSLAGALAVQSFTLQSDMNYVATNASRITRALFELCLRRGWAQLSLHYLCLCKGIDRGILPTATPLAQFDELPRDIVQKIEGADMLLCCSIHPHYHHHESAYTIMIITTIIIICTIMMVTIMTILPTNIRVGCYHRYAVRHGQ